MSGVRLLGFVLLCLVVSPLILLGVALYSLRIFTVCRPRGISGTAYEPFWVRLFLDELGLREDRAAAALAPHLPATTPFIVWCVSGLMCWAASVTGHRGALFTYPPRRPTSPLAMIHQRFEFFDRVLAEAIAPAIGPQVRQVVVLGAGWDTRAYGALEREDVRFFEVDLPPTQRAKRDALREAGIPSDHVTFVETDFNQRSWFDALQRHGFDPQLPTFILWEGVTMYLDHAAVRATLDHVGKLAPGSRIAFDYVSRALVSGVIGRVLGSSLWLYYGESLVFGLPMGPHARDHVAAFVGESGLALADYDHCSERLPFYGFALSSISTEARSL